MQATCRKFKYRLMELFILNFGKDAGTMRRKFMEENQPISREWVSKDFNAEINDSHKIPAERLEKYAQFLNTEVTALRNFQNSLTT